MYKQLYKKIIDKAKEENRMKNQGIYYEKHHIVPDFLFKNRKRSGPKGHLDGDPDSSENIVLLTFSEHLMAHYYLYEIYKNTRYEYSAGSALQFFFVKAVGNHQRQKNLSEVDEQFLKEMDHLRELGNDAISKARSGKMPVVDSITREKIGSVPVDHPKVLAGEWIHHSKGMPSPINPENRKPQDGSNNGNFKELTQDRKERLWECVVKSTDDDYLKLSLLKKEMTNEFSEFKKISTKWVENNYPSFNALVEEVNRNLGTRIKYDPYHRSISQRKKLSVESRKHRWYNDGINNIRVTDIEDFIRTHPHCLPGKIKA